jgi:hypothetical protein
MIDINQPHPTVTFDDAGVKYDISIAGIKLKKTPLLNQATFECPIDQETIRFGLHEVKDNESFNPKGYPSYVTVTNNRKGIALRNQAFEKPNFAEYCRFRASARHFLEDTSSEVYFSSFVKCPACDKDYTLHCKVYHTLTQQEKWSLIDAFNHKPLRKVKALAELARHHQYSVDQFVDHCYALRRDMDKKPIVQIEPVFEAERWQLEARQLQMDLQDRLNLMPSWAMGDLNKHLLEIYEAIESKPQDDGWCQIMPDIDKIARNKAEFERAKNKSAEPLRC